MTRPDDLVLLRGVHVAVSYNPQTKQVLVTAGEANGDQVILALVKAVFAVLSREVRTQPGLEP